VITVIIQRLKFLILVVFGVSLITFTISHLIPGDPARLIAGERAPDNVVERIRADLGLDAPLPVQYWRYIRAVAQGDLGTSIRTRRPVWQDIRIFFPATMELAACALIFAAAVGIPLGVASAVWKNSLLDHFVRLLAVSGISTPAFWLGLLLILLFYRHLQWLPGGGRIDPALPLPPSRTGFLLIDSLLAGDGKAFVSALRYLALPTITLGLVHLGIVARQIRSAMLEVLTQEYIRTARANGLSGFHVIFVHALPNALIPSITVMGWALGDLLYGAVLTETVFAWPGMGSYVVESIQSLDFPAIMGFTLIVSVAYVLVNLAVDLAYMLIDPRIREIA